MLDYAIVEEPCAIVSAMRNKSLDPDTNAAVRSFVDGVVKEDFRGNTTAAARRFKVSQSMLYEFLGGKRGAGMKLLEGVASYTRQPLDVILGREMLSEKPRLGPLTQLEIAVAFFGHRIPQDVVRIVRERAKGKEDELDAWAWGIELRRVRDSEEGLVQTTQRKRRKVGT